MHKTGGDKIIKKKVVLQENMNTELALTEYKLKRHNFIYIG